MKQQWQAQWMAAAYRASEDEWERASSVSGHPGSTSPPVPPSAAFQSLPMNMNMAALMGMGMGMGLSSYNAVPYGYQGVPHPQPFYGYAPPFQHPGPPQGYPGMSFAHPAAAGQGGMYSYGTAAQSVFGGEFGPPALGGGMPGARAHSGMSDYAPQRPSARAAAKGYEGSAARGGGQLEAARRRSHFALSEISKETPPTLPPSRSHASALSRVERDPAERPSNARDSAYLGQGQGQQAGQPRPSKGRTSSSPPSSWRKSGSECAASASASASASMASLAYLPAGDEGVPMKSRSRPKAQFVN
jgi:hypothetical protein